MGKLDSFVLTIGKYQGRSLDNIPLTYLDWLRGELKYTVDPYYCNILTKITDYLQDPAIAKELEAILDNVNEYD